MTGDFRHGSEKGTGSEPEPRELRATPRFGEVPVPFSEPDFQLVLLPGLGADRRLLEPQRQEFPQLVVPPWIPPRKRESLPAYAERMAATIKPSGGLPLVLGGVSLGGMLAYEMAHHLKPHVVVQIASCRTRHAIRPSCRAGRWLLPLIPTFAWEIAKLLAGPVVRLRVRVPAARRDLAVTMFRQADSRFMHWALRAILTWHPTRPQGVRVLQIHGARDLVIPVRRVSPDEVIPDGGHLINVTHAAAVNDFIRRAAQMPH
jgi:pimeloyl-ACP methyl ester carboxylesterase